MKPKWRHRTNVTVWAVWCGVDQDTALDAVFLDEAYAREWCDERNADFPRSDGQRQFTVEGIRPVDKALQHQATEVE